MSRYAYLLLTSPTRIASLHFVVHASKTKPGQYFCFPAQQSIANFYACSFDQLKALTLYMRYIIVNIGYSRLTWHAFVIREYCIRFTDIDIFATPCVKSSVKHAWYLFSMIRFIFLFVFHCAVLILVNYLVSHNLTKLIRVKHLFISLSHSFRMFRGFRFNICYDFNDVLIPIYILFVFIVCSDIFVINHLAMINCTATEAVYIPGLLN